MNLSDLFAEMEAAGSPSPPPIFLRGGMPGEWWQEHVGVEDGISAWQLLCEASCDRSRESPAISRPAWSELLEAERLRRARLLWSLESTEGGSRDPDEVARLRGAEIVLCRADLWRWVDSWAWVEDPHRPRGPRAIPWLCWPVHRALLWWLEEALEEALETGIERHLVLLKSRAIGATWALVTLLTYRLLFREGFGAIVGSITQMELDDGTSSSLLGKVRFALDHQPSWMLPDYQTEKREDAIRDPYRIVQNLINDSRILGGVMNTTFAVSGRADLVARDEAAKVKPKLQTAAKTGATSVAKLYLYLSTPHGKGNEFHFDYETSAERDRLSLPWPVDPRRDDTWYDSQLSGNGGRLTEDQRLQEYGCSFRGIAGYRIWHPDRDVVAYSEETPEWAAVAANARARWPHVGGMDFGEGPSPTVLVLPLVDWSDAIPHAEYGLLPRIWVDLEIVRQRTAPDEVARDILEALEQYRGQRAIYGDPAGKRVSVRQESWEGDLHAHGVPLRCLPEDPFHQHRFISKALDLVDELLKTGRIRIHEHRCPLLLDAVEQWAWDIPDGIRIEQVNRETVKWRKDGWSHLCEALWYAVVAMLQYHQPRKASSGSRSSGDLPPSSIAGDLEGVFGATIDPY